MLKLLERIEGISSCRDRDLLAITVTAALHEFFAPQSLALYRLISRHGALWLEELALHDGREVVFGSGVDSEQLLPLATQPLIERTLRDGDPALHEDADGFSYCFPLTLQQATLPYGFFLMRFAEDPAFEAREALVWMLRFYSNYLSLLDYSELDTLTGLLNRKTFDDVFERLMTRLPLGDRRKARKAERRGAVGDGGHWLALLDLDHFKRINDSFGHLFGDEVLLRLGKLMRDVFRKDDLLFRFGGEEFVVVLHPNTRESAQHALERFRAAVEAHEFPQVGKVTCSIGFTRVQASMAPIDIVGLADRGLYYAKANGRNRVCCYETLVEQGRIAGQRSDAGDPTIDALFD